MVNCYMTEYSNDNRSSSIKKIVAWLDNRYNKRVENENRLKMLEGNRAKKSVLYRIDKMIEYSGFKRRIHFLTAEVLIYSVLILSVTGAGLSLYIWHSWLISLIVVLLFPLVSFVTIYIMSGFYYISLEKSIMTFLNLIDNFNKSEDDIVEIIKRTVPYVDEPLKGMLRDFCSDAHMTGDTRQAFCNLEARIEHDKCREILRNIEVCSRYDSDYGEVIRDCRLSMTDFLSIKSERKAIISNGRVEVIILLVSAALIIMLYGNITQGMWSLLFGTMVGNCLLLYSAVIVIICIVVMVLFDKNGG